MREPGKPIRQIYLSCTKSNEKKRAALLLRANRLYEHSLQSVSFVEDLERADLVMVVGKKETSMEKEICLAKEKGIPVVEVTEQFLEKNNRYMEQMLNDTVDLEFDHGYER